MADALAWASLPTGASPAWLGFRMSVVRGIHRLPAHPRRERPSPAVGVAARHVPSGGAVPVLRCRHRRADGIDPAAADPAAGGHDRDPNRVAVSHRPTRPTSRSGLGCCGCVMPRAARSDWSHCIPSRSTCWWPTGVTVTIVFSQPVSSALFVSTSGQRLNYVNVCATFITLVRRAALTPRPAPCRPRLYDLRHSFAVRTLLEWYRDRAAIASRLPLLST